ncbi:MAG TPA: LysR family transcriptional regulator substrate-binding protein, partial [Chloroflexota bacterium]|nr:LysR family transcriptional regulator substrate-binding protein [Chloroflexota bacterium]
PIRLTPAGELLSRRAHAVFDELDQFQADLVQLAGTQPGHVTIGAVNSAAQFIPELLTEFANRFTEIGVTVREEQQRDLLPLMKRGELDACLFLVQTGTLMPDGPFECARLFSFAMAFAVPPGHPLAGRTDVALRELEHERFVLALGAQARLVKDALGKAGLKPNVAFETNKSAMTVALVASGAGIGLAPDFRVRGAQQELSTFRVEDITLSYDLVLLWDRASRNKLALSAFANLVMAHDWRPEALPALS